MRGPKAARIELSDDELTELEARARRRKTSRGDAMRVSIVLLAASDMTNLAIAKRLRTTRVTVATWRMRFAAKRMDGLSDEPRPGAPRKIGDDKITEVVTATLETMPATATHWSTRSMAQASGLSVCSVHRIWQAFSLQPHRSETFKLSTDPLFAISLASTSIHQSVPWCSASTKNHRSRHWIALSRCCPCALASRAAYPRLQTTWDNLAVRSVGREGRDHYRQVHVAAPGAGVPPIPRHRRAECAG
jgi:transposase